MGTDISLWVLVRSEHIEPDEEYWFEVISDGALLTRRYDVFGELAGIRRDNTIENLFVRKAYWGRGLPRWCPTSVYSFEDTTWLTPSEFLPIVEAMDKNKYDWGWGFIQNAVAELTRNVGNDCVRIVITFTQ